MVEIIRKLIDLSTSFINKIFLLEVEWDAGQYIAIGKIVVAFVFAALTLHMFFDALGLLGED